MIKVQKKRLKKQTLIVIILAIALVALTVGAAVAKNIIDKNNVTPPSYGQPPAILDGEAIYNNYYSIAYPHIESGAFVDIKITTPDGSYRINRPDDKSELEIWFTPDGSDEMQIYLPPITDEEAEFDYTSLYAIEQGDGYGQIYKLTYLCTAIGTPYFDTRIEKPEDTSYEDFLAYYGLDPEHARVIDFAYYEGEGEDRELKAQRLTVGSKTLTGNGYYYMVEGRDRIYVTNNNYFDYAFSGVASLINPRLVAEGLETDSYLEPYLVTDFKQWVTKMHKEEGEAVSKGSTVVVLADVFVPLNVAVDYTPTGKESPDGYIREGLIEREFDLSKYASHEAYEMLVRLLEGSKIGALDEDMLLTALSGGKTVDVKDGASVTYTYTVIAIESVIGERENNTPGTVVADAKLVKVTYTASCDGKNLTPIAHHAVIDLENPQLSDGARAKLRAASVGALTEPIVFEQVYTSDAENKVKIELVLQEIIAVYSKNGMPAKTVEEDSSVTYRYYLRVDGEAGESFVGAAKISELSGEEGERLKSALLGKKAGDKPFEVVDTYVQYPEIMSDFYTVCVKEIKYFVVNELVVSFKYVNASDADPFYGESIYENTLTNEHLNYGLNNGACEAVLKILGGIGDEAATSNGLVGSETLAVGLTPEVMRDYLLHSEEAYRIYIELPRGIYEADDDNDTLEYGWYNTTGFTLYISRELDDGTRYVASDMYDIVTKVPSKDLVFLKYNFIDYWARRSLMLMDIEDVSGIEVDFNMEGLRGAYDFDLTHTTVYVDSRGNKYLSAPENITTSEYDFISIIASQLRGGDDNAFNDYIDRHGLPGKANLDEFYNEVYGGGKPVSAGHDTKDVDVFKNLLQLIYFTTYVDALTEEEQKQALESEAIMTIKLSVEGRSDKYVYKFYGLDDRRIMVSLSRVDASGNPRYEPATDFYLSSFATRKIVMGFMSLLDGEEIDADLSYPD